MPCKQVTSDLVFVCGFHRELRFPSPPSTGYSQNSLKMAEIDDNGNSDLALVTLGIRPPCGLFAGSLRPKAVAIAGSPCGCLKELASTVEVVRSKISGRGP